VALTQSEAILKLVGRDVPVLGPAGREVRWQVDVLAGAEQHPVEVHLCAGVDRGGHQLRPVLSGTVSRFTTESLIAALTTRSPCRARTAG